jgi:hypothetical protein
MCKRCDGTPRTNPIVVTVESDRTCVIVGVAGAGTKVVRGWNFLEAETGISKRTLGYSLALVVGTRLSTRAVADLGGESGQHDEHPNEPEQREESDPSSAPINRAECVQAQTD